MNQKRQIKFLTEAEVRQIIDIIPDDRTGRRDRALLEVLFSTGLRISEALALKGKDLVLDPEKTHELTVIGKGKWQRTVYLSPQAIKAVLRYFAGRKDNDERAFPIGKRRVQFMVKERAKKAGVEKFISPHVFRHSFATDMLRRGVNIYYVQQFLGHRAISSTTIYLHATNKELKDIHEKIYK